MAIAPRKLKRSQASLTGGIIVGVGVFVLSALVTNELGWTSTLRWPLSAALAGAFGIWIRVADL